MIEPILKDPELQKVFDEDGFVKVKLFEKEDIARANELFYRYFPNGTENFFSSIFLDDYETKKAISDGLDEILKPRYERFFKDYRTVGSVFSVKGVGEKSTMRLHQDWSIVDEKKYISANVWVPLIDTTEQNGTLELLKGSHNWKKTIRNPTVPFYYGKYEAKIRTKLTMVEANAGDAVILNHAILHYSKPNLSNDIRIAIASGVASKDSVLRFSYWDQSDPDKIEHYDQENDFFLRYTDFDNAIFERPKKIINFRKEDFSLQVITEEDVDAFLGIEPAVKTKERKGFLRELYHKVLG